MTKTYSLSKPFISKKEIFGVSKVLKSGWLTSGPITEKLEKIIKYKIKTKNVIAVNSATNGIFITLLALGAKKGDEVITPSNTYISTINTLYNLGLKIILCDVNKLTGNVDEYNFKKNISKKTKFFIPVHNGGNPLNIQNLIKISKKYKIHLIEDGATAFGAKVKQKYVGSFNYSTSVFSLHANKIITSGEGGFICTNNNKLAKKIRLMVNSGLSKNTWRRMDSKNYRILNAVLPGYKFNFNDILASIAIEQIKKIEKIISYRLKIKKRYLKNFKELIAEKKFYTHKTSENNKSSLYNFSIILNYTNNMRDKLANFLQKKKIFSAIHYTPAHKHQFYNKKISPKKLKNTDILFNSSLSLPFHNKLNFNDVDYISKQVKKFFNEIK